MPKRPDTEQLELAERVVWHTATSDVRPLKKKRRLPPAKLTPAELAAKPIKAKAATAGGSTRTKAYDAKIDLHGMTESGAHSVLTAFIHHQRARGAQRLLVITGKGSGNNGQLRANVPRWLEVETLARFITSIEAAPLQLGGDGALIVRLKKLR